VCRIRAKEFLAMAVDIIALVIPSDYPHAPSRQLPSHFSHKLTTLERVARQAHKELEQDTDRLRCGVRIASDHVFPLDFS
jgi:hypothetical protein